MAVSNFIMVRLFNLEHWLPQSQPFFFKFELLWTYYLTAMDFAKYMKQRKKRILKELRNYILGIIRVWSLLFTTGINLTLHFLPIIFGN